MSTRVNVNLAFTADTSQAKASLKDLQTNLNDLTMNAASGNLGKTLTANIRRGIDSAVQLKAMLASATDVDTGKLNLNQFTASLKNSGTSLMQLKNDLKALGPEGEAAFNKASKAIQQATIPMRKASTALDKLWVTMKNTMKWQISAAAIQMFTQGLSSAFSYAKDLNESLNNIRIVTGYSTDEMAKFAEKANKAAKALSTSTTAYTDAALIYYQQGLKGSDVTQRTDTTVKLANVTGESAETVSEWMTAIWNNFEDGSKTLEYYADVVAKLGAETASSAEEIATGLEKFSAVADTVGLSYEYATAALATVTSETRQSADVVGTAFKTLFARMQDLKLGNTLEDGTTLGQYSEAMMAVGVNIKTASGELKNMNSIIDELGLTWKNLDKDQQVALAKSVAGLRQYNQFISLMDNYDIFKNNVSSAEEATGVLTQQHKIYEESWEAASKRVKASSEGLIQSLIDDKTFINLTDGLAKFIEGIEFLVDALGGLGGILPLILTSMTSIFGPKMLASARDFGQQLKMTSTIAQEDAINLKLQTIQAESEKGNVPARRVTAAQQEAELKKQALHIEKELSEEEIRQVNEAFEHLETLQQIQDELEKVAKADQNEQETEKRHFLQEDAAALEEGLQLRAGENKNSQSYLERQAAIENYQNEKKGLVTSARKNLKEAAKDEDDFLNSSVSQERKAELMNKYGITEDDINRDKNNNITGFKSKKKTIMNRQQKTEIENMKKQTDKLNDSLKKYGIELTTNEKQINKVVKSSRKYAESTQTAIKHNKKVTGTIKSMSQSFTNLNKIGFGEAVMQSFAGITSLASGINMVTSGVTQLQEKLKTGEATFSDWLSAIMSIGMGLPMILKSMQDFSKILQQTIIFKTKDNTLTYLGTIFSQKKLMAIAAKAIAEAKENEETKEGILLKAAENALDEAGVSAKLKNTIATLALKKAKDQETGAVWKSNMAWLASPLFWIPAIIAAVIVALIALIAILSNHSKAVDAYNKKVAEESAANVELINSNQELASSVKDLTEEYYTLQSASESTMAVMQKMKEEIPKLIDSYKELEKSMHIDLGLEQLEAAYQYFLDTGDIDWYNKEQQRVDSEIKEEEKKQTKQGVSATNALLGSKLTKGQGRKGSDGHYTRTLGGHGEAGEIAAGILEEVLGDFGDMKKNNFQVDFDMNDPNKVAEYISKLSEADTKLKERLGADKYASSGIADEIQNEMAKFDQETLEQAKILSDNAMSLNVEDFDNKDHSKPTNLSDYKAQKAKYIEEIKKEYGYDDKTAEDFLQKSKTYGDFETELSQFEEGGNVYDAVQKNAKLSLDAVMGWYDGLSDEDKNFAIGLDYTVIGDKLDFDKALADAKEANKILLINEEAKEAEIDTSTLDAYTEILQSNNDALENNDDLARQIALDNIKLNKGLQNLGKTWKDQNKVLARGERNTIEYAEAVGALKDNFEEAFGYKPSTEFIEGHLTDIQDLVNGDVEKLDELQTALAKDYVANMEYRTPFNSEDGKNFTAQQIQDELNGLLDKLDTSIEFGEDATISANYYDKLQEMLDSGQLTHEQLTEAMRLKGFEIEYNEWKEIDGPTTTTTIKTFDSKDRKNPIKTEIIEEGSKLKVPVINGNGPKGQVAAPTVTRSVSDSSIDAKSLKEASGAPDRKIEDEIDRYHEIRAVISNLNKELDRLSEAKDRAYGKNRLKLIDDEIAKTKELQKAKEEEISQMQKTLLEQASYVKGYGGILDENGNITNYNDLIKKHINLDDENYEEFKETLSLYEETLNEVQDAQDEIINNQYKLQDLALEKTEYEIEYKVEIEERELEFIEYMMSKIEDDAFKAGESIALLTQKTNSFTSQADSYIKGIKDILEDAGASSSQVEAYLSGAADSLDGLNLDANQIEKLRDFSSSLLDISTNLQDIDKEIQDLMIDSFETMVEEFDTSADRVDTLTSSLQSYIDIVDLVGKNNLGITSEDMIALNNTVISSLEQQAKITLDKRNSIEQSIAETRLRLNEEIGEHEREQLEEFLKTQEDALAEANSNLAEAVSAQIEAIQEKWTMVIEDIGEKFSKALGGAYGNLEYATEAFERQKKLSELYLQDFQKTYEVSKLLRDVGKSIDETDNVKYQQELAKLQEEIAKYQAAGVKMSQQDLDFLQKRYNLKLAEMALEEARNAKSQVTLRRDAAGNYGYVYTADEDKISEAQGKYEEELYNFQQWSYEQEVTSMENYLSALTEYNSRRTEIMETYKDDLALQKQALQDLEFEYVEYLKFMFQEQENLLNYNSIINAEYLTNMADRYQDTFIGRMYPDVNSFGELERTVLDAINRATEDTSQAHQKMQIETSEALDLLEQDSKTFKDMLVGEDGKSGYMGAVRDGVDEIGAAASELPAKFESGFQGMISAIRGYQDEFENAIKPYATTIDDLYSKVQSIINYEGSGTTSSDSSTTETPLEDKIETDVSNAGGAVKDYFSNDGDKTLTKIDENTAYKYNDSGAERVGDYVRLQDGNWYKKDDEKYIKQIDDNTYQVKEGAQGISHINFNSGVFKNTGQTVTNLEDGKSVLYYVTDKGYVKTSDAVSILNTDLMVAKEGSIKSSLPKETVDFKNLKFDEPLSTITNILPFDSKGNKYSYNSLPDSDGAITQVASYLMALNNEVSDSTVKIEKIGDKRYIKFSKIPVIYTNEEPDCQKFYFTKDYKEYSFDKKENCGLPGYVKASDFDVFLPLSYFEGYNSFDTGGYTGEWGPEGRWAMLHQKEIVLNKHDTENFLTAIDILRGMQDNLLSTQMQQALQKFSSNITSSLNNTSNNTTTQNIYVTAEFPNATDHNEIEQAFNNLANDFSQRVNKV